MRGGRRRDGAGARRDARILTSSTSTLSRSARGQIRCLSCFSSFQTTKIKCDFDDGVFLLAGSLQPKLGGGILAHNTSLPDLQSRVNTDPFVVENVVTAEFLEIDPARADARLKFLLD